MKYLFFLCLFLTFADGFAQGKKDAQYYFDIGLKKESDPELKKAGNPFKEAFPYFFKASELAKDGSELQLKAFYRCAYLYNYAELGEQPLIIKRTIKGLHYLRKLNSTDQFAADYFFRAGIAYMLDYRPDSAIYAFSEARTVFQKLKGNYATRTSDCDHGIGDVYSNILYEYSKAEDFYERALIIREKAGQDEINIFLVSKLYSELASVNRAQHDYEKALSYGLRNVTIIEMLNIEKYNNYRESAYVIVADIYSDMGHFSEAVIFYQKAILLSRKKNPNGITPFLGDYYFGLADVFQKARKEDQAIPYYLKAIAIYNLVPNYKSVLHIKSYQRLGESYLTKGNMANSYLNFRKATELLNEYGLKKSGQASELYRLVGNYFLVDQQIDSAFVYYQRALKAASNYFESLSWEDNPSRKNIVLDDFTYKVLLSKSTLLSSQYKKTKNIDFAIAALASFDLAEKLLVDSRAKLDMDNAKWSFFDSNFGLYQQALSLLYQMEKDHHADSLIRKAFYYMESSKAKMLSDALNEAEFARPLLTSDSLVQFLDLQRRNLYQLQNELKKVESNTAKQASLRDLMVDVDRNIQRAENEIALKYPAYVKTKYRYDIPDIAKVQAFSRKRNAAIVEFFWGPDEVFGLALHGNNVIFKKLAITDSIQSNVNGLVKLLTSDRYSYTDVDVNFYEKKATALYQLLLVPFELTINQTDRLIILPDGPLEQVPFEALISKKSTSVKKSFATLDYLLRTYSISYSFSSSYLLNQSGEKLDDPKMLAFGLTQGSRLRSGGNSDSTMMVEQLPGSESELKAILAQFPKGEYLYGEGVTEEIFKKKAPYFDLIHLAVHGTGDTEQQYSASLFFRDDTSSKEDGRLHWFELFGLRLKAKLAVISSCESGIGKTYRGEGMLSMASAFAFAGCKNLVMGLWKVDDRVSADIMTEFYGNLRGGTQVDVALANAKRSYVERSDNLTANPKLWASLVCYGNEQLIEESDNLGDWILLLSIIGLLSLVVFYMKRRSLFFSKQTPS